MRVPTGERVPNTEFRTLRHRLGMSKLEMAEYLYVRERSVLHWEEGRYPPPEGVLVELEALDSFTYRIVQVVKAQVEKERAENPQGWFAMLDTSGAAFTARMIEAAREAMDDLDDEYGEDGTFDFDRLGPNWWLQVCTRAGINAESLWKQWWWKVCAEAGLEPDGDLTVKRSRLPEPGIPRP